MSSWDKEWSMCHSGKHVFPFDLKVEDIDVNDIAHATAMQCRYNGHVERFYSVAEHMVHIGFALMRDFHDPVLALQGLLHDAGEAYTGDFTRPCKNSLPEAARLALKDAEDRNEATIFRRYGLAEKADPRIKDYDRRIIVDEKRVLFGPNKPWDWDLVPLDVQIKNWSPEVGKEVYLATFMALMRPAQTLNLLKATL